MPTARSLLLTLLPALAAAAPYTCRVTVAAGEHDRADTPISVGLALPGAAMGADTALLTAPDGTTLVGQLHGFSLFASHPEPVANRFARELSFVVPRLAAGQTLTYQVTVPGPQPVPGQGFRWRDAAPDLLELRHGDRPVLQYVHPALDDATPQRRESTYKVFHHLFDPAGRQLLTKGPGGLYTHHRGIFYGFNKVVYGDAQQVDIWHCSGQTHQAHGGTLDVAEGPVCGRHRVLVEWRGKAQTLFAREERELTVWSLPGGTLVQFASRLRSVAGRVTLDGDPQHAGFHFRAAQEVAERTKGETVYLRPDGRDRPGATRNWPGQKTHVNLPWDAMSFTIGGQRYTVAYLDRPQNPKEARYSERDYGRFGSYFVADCDENRTLDVAYRLWVQEGEPTAAPVQARADDLADPSRVSVAE